MLEERKNALEALLFVAGGPLDIRQAATLLELPPDTVEELARQLMNEYAAGGLQIVPVAGGYQMCTRNELADYIEKLLAHERGRLSRAAMETMAIIAYKQPVTRAEIEAIRGVNCDGVIERLSLHRLIKVVGRKDTVGRPILYGTTEEFLEYFGFGGLNDLPPLPEEKEADDKKEATDE